MLMMELDWKYIQNQALWHDFSSEYKNGKQNYEILVSTFEILQMNTVQMR